MSYLVNLEKVSKGFWVKNKLMSVIHDINFNVNDNEVVSIIGSSGCGKTTLLKIIANIIEPDSGTVFFKDGKIMNARINHSIGYVPQSHTLLPNRTVFENITLPLELEGKHDFKFALELLELIGLKEYKDYYPSQISGGMKQKVSIARALVYNPELLLLDEPFASVDEISREKYNLELLRLNKILKRSIILVTHNIEEAVFMSDRILIMSNLPGEIIKQVEIPLGNNRSPATRSEELFFSTTNTIRKLIKT
jgi:NitT/TauT family transport system ATP-binding protein